MGQYGRGELLEVVRQRVLPALQGGGRLRRAQQMQRRARGGAESEVGVDPGGGDQLHRVPPHRLRDVHRAHRLDQLHDLVRVRHRLQVLQRGGPAVHVQHPQLGLDAGIAHGDTGHEAVALRLGQRVGALHLDRVLRRHHHEGARQFVAVAVDGDLPLLHGLQQRRLGLGRGAVDLVADHDLREDRARLELEVTAPLVPDGDPGDVRGQQVGGELDAPHRAVDGPRQRLGQHGLAHAGDVLDQQVPLGEQHGQREPYDLGLALDHVLHRSADTLRGGGQIPPRARLRSSGDAPWLARSS